MECVHTSTSSKDSEIIPEKEAERMHVVLDDYKKINSQWLWPHAKICAISGQTKFQHGNMSWAQFSTYRL